MFYKNILALVVWCHCYQVVLDPFIQLLAYSLRFCPIEGANSLHNHLSAATSSSSSLYLVRGASLIVEANQVALTPGHDIVLRCNLTDYPDQEFTWSRIRHLPKPKPELPEEDMIQIRDKYIIQNNQLTLKSPNNYDIGDYYCRVKNPSYDMESQKVIRVRPRPYIFDFELEDSTYRSAAIELGQSLKIVCNVLDAYTPDSDIKLKWTMSRFEEDANEEIVPGEENIRFETYNLTSQALIIDEVTKDHRRFFKCHASNGITDNSKVILIRIKNKYDFIWPSVGIILEFIILIFVICVVENRKVEPENSWESRILIAASPSRSVGEPSGRRSKREL